MASAQALSESDRRLVAAWAADCAERVLFLFESEAPDDDRPRDGIARARAFAAGTLDASGEIRRRFVAGRASQAVTSPAAKAAAWAAGQAAGVAHMGAHALGAAAYAAVSLEMAGLGLAGRVDVGRLRPVVARYAAGPVWAFLSICPSRARAADATRPTSMA
ncbi:hypothetical protein NQ166_10800 [Microbacterium sp. zg.Y1090]|nr:MULTISPECIES: hypothetical protein [unclassified Microbacterium]MCR2819313.1 hypothetical protein [Microbacterium sp. zg.Y1090]MDL5487230.1 hypothetical protein [Microbacterium sp. zg-Y1211]WIM29792.1 hypothetical protein QNO26_14300 [Microbacterium sp. zg-Y1090]